MLIRRTAPPWQQIIWREWRNCPDPDYAQQLFELVADEPAGWGPRASFIGLNGLTGASLGLVIGFLFSSNWEIIRQFMLAGGIIGGLTGYLAGRQLSWRQWLRRLVASTPTSDWPRFIGNAVLICIISGMIFGPMFWLGLVGLFWGIGGLIPWLNRSSTGSDPSQAEERRWWVWWLRRPRLLEVEEALQQACRHPRANCATWQALLARLAERRTQDHIPESLVQGLLSSDWQERFVTTYLLVGQGDQVAYALQKITGQEDTPLHQTVAWILRNQKSSQRHPSPQPSRGDLPT